jgi:hypothetical protein
MLSRHQMQISKFQIIKVIDEKKNRPAITENPDLASAVGRDFRLIRLSCQ